MREVSVDKNVVQIRSIIEREARRNAGIKRDLRNFTRRVHRYWKRIAPVGDPTGGRYVENFGGPLPKHWQQRDTNAGAYKAGIVIRRHPRRPYANGFPHYQVAATATIPGKNGNLSISHWIEYGTGGQTPTPEFACRQRTVTRFGAMGNVRMRTSGVDEPWSKTMRGEAGPQTKIPDSKEPRRMGVIGLELSGTPQGKPARKGRGYERIDRLPKKQTG